MKRKQPRKNAKQVPTWSPIHGGKILNASMLAPGREYRLKITAVSDRETHYGRKLCVHFANSARTLVLNETNRATLEQAFGDSVQEWPGWWVRLFRSATLLHGKPVDCIRVKVVPCDG